MSSVKNKITAVVNKAAMVTVKSMANLVISVNILMRCYHIDYRNIGNFGNKDSHGNMSKGFSHECAYVFL